ncbi:hypothetical protein RJ641_036483 [Dillenia turbinata]|uniref:Uncharacterized protein n=1 Tax=Dillenia turbinata TaxID=194707 RepID=A0AAN8VKW7_9MAGN
MSRQAQLPPRCPFQKKIVSRPITDSHFSYPHHHKSSSQSSILEEQPEWFDELSSNPEAHSKGLLHRRSASDSLTLLEGLVPFSSLGPPKDDENSGCNEARSGMESSCVYGPNSPRQRGNLSFSENAIVSALSEYVSQNSLGSLGENHCLLEITHLESKVGACNLGNEISTETRAGKKVLESFNTLVMSEMVNAESINWGTGWHSRQWSRVRKLQHIAELERTVSVFEALESELTIRVASMLQQRVSLSLEDSKLKQQVARLRQEKLPMEGQYQTLMDEVDRLKNGFQNPSNRKLKIYHGRSLDSSDTTWQTLDMGKLNISGIPAAINNGFRS